MRQALENYNGGVQINDKKFNNLRYADDITLFAKDETEMARIFKLIADESSAYGLEINKIKLMIVDGSTSIQLTNVLPEIEIVKDFI